MRAMEPPETPGTVMVPPTQRPWRKVVSQARARRGAAGGLAWGALLALVAMARESGRAGEGGRASDMANERWDARGQKKTPSLARGARKRARGGAVSAVRQGQLRQSDRFICRCLFELVGDWSTAVSFPFGSAWRSLGGGVSDALAKVEFL